MFLIKNEIQAIGVLKTRFQIVFYLFVNKSQVGCEKLKNTTKGLLMNFYFTHEFIDILCCGISYSKRTVPRD